MMTSIRAVAGLTLLATMLPQPALAMGPASDIVDTAIAAGSFQTLATALTEAGLIETLKQPGPFTVFAPTDEAFAQLPKGTVEKLLRKENRSQLRAILTYHVVPGRYDASTVTAVARQSTVNRQRLDVRLAEGKVMVDDATVVRADIACSNGVIHVIDRVMLPTSDTIAAVATKAGSFATLLAAAKAAGLVDALTGANELTLFAPTDDAFRKLPAGTVDQLLRPEAKARLAAILRYHVVPGRVYADATLSAGRAESLLSGGQLEFGIVGGRLQVSGASVIQNDVEASNGVVHVIDSVLLPEASLLPQLSGRKVIGIYNESPSKALAAQLNLDAHKTLLITGFPANSNAQKAGIEKYDIIVGIDGGPATDSSLTKAKEKRDVGSALRLDLLRAGRKISIDVPVGLETH